MQKNENNKKGDKLRKKRVDEIANLIANHTPNKTNIPGIYNYCDRWCEKCKFTHRCTNYEMTEGWGLDANPDKLAETLEGIFKGTLQMIEIQLHKLGIKLPENLDDFDEESLRIIENSEAKTISKTYAHKLAEWFKNNMAILEQRSIELLKTSESTYLAYNEAIETLNWYMFFIEVKINRAYHSFKGEEDFGSYDQNGSAKIALIAIDKSIDALLHLLEIIPEKEDDFLQLLAMLSQTRKIVEAEKPGARLFIRPGFDENV